ncbi:apolipo protein O-domain-containing protein [Limtongia smithiae]|uniref:apolipo protein O-domain-containing protein n=1 Tax=Limtongia smithiae TaxID=1125753 RepID=UPI0034CEBEEC
MATARRSTLMAMSAGAVAGATFVGTPIVAAETKPIYDDDETEKAVVRPTTAPIVIKEPPALLSSYVRSARESLAEAVRLGEIHLELGLEKYLEAESSVTTTVASLKADNEPILPGAIYVAVATLTGTIVARRRNMVVRGFLSPALFGVAAFAYFLPTTYKNVGDLLWRFEVLVPQVADAHLQTRKAVEDAVGFVKTSAGEVRGFVDETVKSARKGMKGATGLLTTDEEEKKK